MSYITRIDNILYSIASYNQNNTIYNNYNFYVTESEIHLLAAHLVNFKKYHFKIFC